MNSIYLHIFVKYILTNEAKKSKIYSVCKKINNTFGG